MKYIQLEPELCNTIREFRSKCKITAAEVSEILGKSSAYCNKIENGKVAKIKEEDFRNLFSAMIQNAGGIINVSFNFFIRRLFSVLYNSVKMTSDLLKASQILPAYFQEGAEEETEGTGKLQEYCMACIRCGLTSEQEL